MIHASAEVYYTRSNQTGEVRSEFGENHSLCNRTHFSHFSAAKQNPA